MKIDLNESLQQNRLQMKCDVLSHVDTVKTCIAWTSFDFRFKDFFSDLHLKIVIYCVTDQLSIARSRRSVLSPHFYEAR